MTQFVHLHLHSQYSLLDGANRIDDVIAARPRPRACRRSRSPTTATCSAPSSSTTRRKAAGIKPIIGIEAYVAQGSRLRTAIRSAGAATTWCCWRENATGYRNLLKLTTRSYLEGFYYKPRIDHELLRQHARA